MEGFKANPKMKSDIACYKEGGSVYKSRTHKEDPTEAAEDKAMVKKGIRQHEAAKHKGEDKTEIKLKDGRRVPKTKGTVNKYKTGGGVDAAEKGKPSGAKDPMKKVKAAPKKAATPSAATKGKKKETAKPAKGPSTTMSMVGALPEAAAAPSAAMSMPEDQPIEMMADGGVPGGGSISDAERMALMQAMGRRRRTPTGVNMGPIGQQALQSAGAAGGLGNAINTGPLGGAAPAGASSNAPMSPQEQDIMRGLQAVGGYCKGGKAY